jgi:aspartate aminotransferase
MSSLPLSALAEHIIGSEIIRIGAEVNERIRSGARIFNMTIGDFNPAVFPVPEHLSASITKHYQAHQTNYPAAEGMAELRQAIAHLLRRRGGLEFNPADEILVAGGARPLIYSIYRTIVDPGEFVLYGVPSWNNNHYTYLNNAHSIMVPTLPENNFMPGAKDIEPHIDKITLLALCSPQNPTGTVFTKQDLLGICSLVIEENKKRLAHGKKPVYVMYDQIYWELTYGDTVHYDPVSLMPEMKPFTIYVDGISKSLAATGVRVGWCTGPKHIIAKMKAILTHIGAWAPRAEQLATADFLLDVKEYDAFLEKQKSELEFRLNGFYQGFSELQKKGLPIRAIAPQAALYLTVEFPLHGWQTDQGMILHSTKDITTYLLDTAGVALVPFYAFGAPDNSPWYRLSVGTCSRDDVYQAVQAIESALLKIKAPL